MDLLFSGDVALYHGAGPLWVSSRLVKLQFFSQRILRHDLVTFTQHLSLLLERWCIVKGLAIFRTWGSTFTMRQVAASSEFQADWTWVLVFQGMLPSTWDKGPLSNLRADLPRMVHLSMASAAPDMIWHIYFGQCCFKVVLGMDLLFSGDVTLTMEPGPLWVLSRSANLHFSAGRLLTWFSTVTCTCTSPPGMVVGICHLQVRQLLPSPYHHLSRSNTGASKCAKSCQHPLAEKWRLADLLETHRGTCPMVRATSPEDSRSILKTPLKQHCPKKMCQIISGAAGHWQCTILGRARLEGPLAGVNVPNHIRSHWTEKWRLADSAQNSQGTCPMVRATSNEHQQVHT